MDEETPEPSIPVVDADGLERLENATAQMVEMGSKLTAIYEKISNEVGASDSALQQGFRKTKESIDATISSADKLYNSVEVFASSRGIEVLKNNLANAGQIAVKTAVEMYKAFSGSGSAVDSMNTVLSASIPLIAAFGQQKAIKALGTEILELNKMLKEVDKQAIQTAMSIGTMEFPGADIGQAVQYAGNFNKALSNSIITTRSTREEVLAVNKAFADFGTDAIVNSEELIGTITGLNSALNLQNQALLISKATGLDSTQVAKDMAEMQKTLGISAERAAQAFGLIDEVGRRSGIGISRTAQSIVGLTKDLKFWGTTVEGIAPVFDSFSKSLQGVGKQGLTPELLSNFVGGLQRMNFSTRALLGLQSPSMRAGGALGAGLEMEEALAKGDFGKISENLISTLKQFGGPKLLTRGEALETGQERQYMIQRQLLGQTTGITDTAQQDLMLKVLQDIEKGGSGSMDAMKALGGVLKRGEQVAEETLSLEDKATQEVTAAIHGSGQEIVMAIQEMSQSMGISGFLEGVSGILKGAVQMGGVDAKLVDSMMRQLSESSSLGQHISGAIEKMSGEIKDLFKILEYAKPEERTAIEKEIQNRQEDIGLFKQFEKPVDQEREMAIGQAIGETTAFSADEAIEQSIIPDMNEMTRESALAQSTKLLESLQNAFKLSREPEQELELAPITSIPEYTFTPPLTAPTLPGLDVGGQIGDVGIAPLEITEPMFPSTTPEDVEPIRRELKDQEAELTIKIKTEITDDGRIVVAAQQAVFDKLPAWLHAEATTGRSMG